MEPSKTEQHPLLKIDKAAKTVTHPFYCFNGVINLFDNAGRESMSKVV